MDLFKLSICVSLIGVFFLLALSNFLEPKLIEIKSIDAGFLDKPVKINGQILNIRNYNQSNFQVLLIQDKTGKIEIVINKITNLQKLQNITAIGRITEYEKDLQVQADKIYLVK